jgi:hypothetical protein
MPSFLLKSGKILALFVSYLKGGAIYLKNLAKKSHELLYQNYYQNKKELLEKVSQNSETN